MRLLQASDVDVRVEYLQRPTAVLSIDVESDYGSPQCEALGRLDDLLRVIAELNVPLTAFVEGQFFANRPDVCAKLVSAGVDVQLHCFDHLKDGDDPADLGRGVEAYHRYMGRLPTGYRAHTYRLTQPLFASLKEHGFHWDSSILPAIARGGNRAAAFWRGDYCVLDESIHEFPLATWPTIQLPIIHSYRLLIGRPTEHMFRRIFGLPKLVIYDMHMADLVWSRSLDASPLPSHVKWLYRYMWGFNRGDTFGSLRRFVHYLRSRRYEFRSMSDLYGSVT